ncbi:baseplate J-like protein [Halogranum tailed virus 1]|uniref:Baseplate J-like protein n=1 Tax=Halogranum tailed virus 1 TaxID=1273749 RepID=R4TGI4_9CAUD|nr:baseplate J-like protein [Halogranum tailed virus 1]AGM11356.1 baseplate J-like protein [Halogranum tailed virus 1]
MTAHDPRTSEEIYEELKTRLQNKIPKLTNFVKSSFNYVFTNAFASEQHEAEVAATAVQLSGWADYAGKQLTADDLDTLGIDGATAEEINQFVSDSHLDEFAKAFGVSRDPGARAVGDLEITTNSAVTIPAGTTFGTQPDATGDYIAFELVDDVTANSATTITAEIQAVEIGEQGNVGSGTITYLPSPPAGVSSVTNPQPTSGGADEQSNDSLRVDVKNAVVESAEGGTTAGLEAYIENNSGATSALVQEKFTGDAEHGSYPHGDVIVYGGTDQDVQDAIDFAHPSGVEHFLVRPDIIEVGVTAEAEGTDIDTTEIEQQVTDFFNELDLGGDVYRDKLIQIVMNADPDIDNLASLEIEVQNEDHTFSTGTDVYQLDKGMESDDEDDEGITEVTGTLSGTPDHTFVEDTDYQEWNSVAGDTSEPHDSIDWSLAGDDPDDGTDFYVDYIVAEDITIATTEVAQLNNVTVTVV